MSSAVVDHHADIESYCQDVLAGRRPACKWEKLSVQRHIDDLDRQGSTGFPYRFDLEKATKIISFGELFPHVKGKWARAAGKANRIKLQPWQKFILANIFGWLHVDTGLRKHSIVYCCVPRKNGKSVIASIIGLYMLTEDGEYGAEVYCGATTERQAWEVFRPAQKMAEKTPQFRRAYGVSSHAKRLECDKAGAKALPDGSKRFADGSRFEPVIGKPGDGASPSCAILDEVHEHPDDTLYDTMLTGMGAREQPLLLMITTAGSNISGPCFQTQRDVEAVLEGSRENESIFGIIYTIDDPENEWKTREGLIKANPNFGVSVGEAFLMDRVRDALQSARKRAITLTKHFNVWVNARNAWLNMVEWNACADHALDINGFVGEESHLGADLSESDDLTAVVKSFRREIDGKDHYYFFGRYYATEEKVREIGLYQEWVDDGHLIETEGSMIDYEVVEDHIAADAEQFHIAQCFFDPHGAAHLAQRVERDHGIEAVKMPQTYTVFTAYMRDFEGLVKARRIHHDGNPCLTWMMGNVVAKQTDDGKMMRPVKENRESKIDGAVALLQSFIGAYKPDDTYDEDAAMAEYFQNPVKI